MTDRRSHADHDLQLITAHAAGDLSGRDRDDASRLVAECPDCAQLHADLLVITRATHDLPRLVRSRDFRLSQQDAARLAPGAWRRFVALLAGPRFALARPLGAAFATLGLAGLLLASLPGVPLAGSAVGPAAQSAAPGDDSAAVTYGPAAAPPRPDTLGGAVTGEEERMSSGNPQPVEAPSLRSAGTHAGTAAGQGGGVDGAGAGGGTDAELAQQGPDTALAILSGSFLIVGVALFGLRWTARRLGD
jgi:hypothetical protein